MKLTKERLAEIKKLAKAVNPPNEYDKHAHESNRCEHDCVLCAYYGRGQKKGRGPKPAEVIALVEMVEAK